MIDVPFNKYQLSMSNSKQLIFLRTIKLPPVFTHKLCLAYYVIFHSLNAELINSMVPPFAFAKDKYEKMPVISVF